MTHERDAAASVGDGQVPLPSLSEDSAEDLYENAPCGYLSTRLDGQITKVNGTLLNWLGYRREELVGRRRFADLLTVGGKLYHETHFAPLLRLQGEINGIALELKVSDGSRLPVLVTSTVKTGDDGDPLLIRTTVFEARDRRAYETELLRARQEAERAREEADQARREADEERDRLLSLNTTLQRTLLPPALDGVVPGLDVAAHYHVASVDEVGGDFYDLFQLDAGVWAFFMGDVCGKGTAAAAVTSLARYTLRAAAVRDRRPATVLGTLNTVLNYEDEPNDEPRFCTAVFGTLTADDGGFHVTLASGGHPPALVLRADGTVGSLDTPGGQLIGVLPHADIATTSVRLGPGDTLLLYTDGLIEAHTTRSGGRYSDAALRNFAEALAPTTASATVTALTELLDAFGSGVEDDTAVLAISVPRAGRTS